MAAAHLKVLSIVGAGRSGTTVLASILGEIDGFTSAGELRFLWDRGVLRGQPCACGARPTECEVWSPVIEKTLEGSGAGSTSEAVEEIVRAQWELGRPHNLPRVLRAAPSPHAGWPALDTVRHATTSAFMALAALTGASVVVDTSKRPLDAAVLAGVPSIDHYVLHVVRDPHAVVHSWRRAKTFTAGGQTRAIGTRSMPSTVRRWTVNCVSAEVLRQRLEPSRWLHIRYEDFATAPRATLDGILRFVGQEATTPFLDDQTVALGPNHIVAGNPSRFVTGAVAIQEDDEWQRTMGQHEKTAIDVLTLPLRWRYGYTPATFPSGLR